ncbi:unnamed protein product [Scytosiphon promiscuus]
MGVHIYHGGHVEFFICNTDDDMGPDDIPTQACFNRYPLNRAERDDDASPIDENYPGRYYVDPPCRVDEIDQEKPAGAMEDAYVITARYQLPETLTCEHCILQMVHYTGNHCKHDGYDDFKPDWPSTCAPDNESWINTDLPTCGDSGSYPEEFWGCSDISISPMSVAAAKTCDGTVRCPSGENLYLGQYCTDCDQYECCGGGLPQCSDFAINCAAALPCNGLENRMLATYETSQTTSSEDRVCQNEFKSECPAGEDLYFGKSCTDCDEEECCGGSLGVLCGEYLISCPSGKQLSIYKSCGDFGASFNCNADFCCEEACEGDVLCPDQECSASFCCAPATCEASTFDPERCLSGKIDEPTKECFACGPTECCEELSTCEDISIDPDQIVVPTDSCGRDQPIEVAISQTAFTIVDSGGRFSHTGCFDGWKGNVYANGMQTLEACYEYCTVSADGAPFGYFSISFSWVSCVCGRFLPQSAKRSDGSCLGAGWDIFQVNAFYTLDIFNGVDYDRISVLPLQENLALETTPNELSNLVVRSFGVDDSSCKSPVDTICPCDHTNGNNGCPGEEICCEETSVCIDKSSAEYDVGACGDPHMMGFLGQKFDFTGEDGAWYSLIADLNMNVNMRVTAPVPNFPEITYITGLSILTTDANGFDHIIIVEVKRPKSLDSGCPPGASPCLADGSLRVTLDGEEGLFAPGTARLGPDLEISAANLPGACRSFGFEKYWERKKLEQAHRSRRLGEPMSMGEWILGDPTATNMEECVEYVARAEAGEGGVFAHQSEHASFRITTPTATIRLSHGRLHQIAMRDPTNQHDLPDHLTWQMNVAVDRDEISRRAKGILGETIVPTRDASGNPIMTGMKAIRGEQEDYRVEGSMGKDFVLGLGTNRTHEKAGLSMRSGRFRRIDSRR